MSVMDNNDKYGKISRFLHWTMGILFLLQLLSAAAHAFLEDTMIEQLLWPTHKHVGFLILLLAVIRILWALLNRSRRPPFFDKAAKLGHLALYCLMFLVPSLALLRQYGSGRAFDPLGMPLFAGFEPEIVWMVAPGNLLHGFLGWLLFLLIAGHVFMVFWHKVLPEHPDVLPRMWR